MRQARPPSLGAGLLGFRSVALSTPLAESERDGHDAEARHQAGHTAEAEPGKKNVPHQRTILSDA